MELFEQAFSLPPELILELERKTGAGIGSFCRRLFAGDFRHAEITETIRLGLIGGGNNATQPTPWLPPIPRTVRWRKLIRWASPSLKHSG